MKWSYTGAMEKNTEDILEALVFIRDRMATKDDIEELRAEMATKSELAAVRAELGNEIGDLRSEMRSEFMHLRAEIRAIHQRLEEIEKELANHTGFAKEIDHLLERIRAIEAHLDIHPSPFSPSNKPL